MSNYIVKQKDIELLMQSDKTLFYKLELLNKDFKILDSIEGNLISDSISISSDSDVRRTYNCTLLVTDSTFELGYGKKIFFDRLIRPYIGILHQRTNEVVYYLLGTYLFTDTNYSYDATNNTLSLTCNDMMCLLNGVRGGNLPLYTRTIKRGVDAREIITEILKEVGITKYIIEFNLNNNPVPTFEIPYDLVYNAGMNAYQMIKDMVDLYPGTQMYFDLNGTFIISRKPTKKDERVVLNDELLQPILISEQTTTSLKDIYNHIEIWGKVNETDFYSKEITCSDNVYNVHVVAHKTDEATGETVEVTYDTLDNFDTFTLLIPKTNASTQYININNLGNVKIVNDEGNSPEANYLNENTDCVFRYRKEDNTFLYVGQYQCYSNLYVTNNVNDTNKDAIIDSNNEFAIEKIGDKLKVLSGGDYDKIPTNFLCRRRCEWEMYQAINRQINLNLNCLAVPWLDVNMLIEFTSNSNNKTDRYIINNISANYADYTMTISANKYYAEFV